MCSRVITQRRVAAKWRLSPDEKCQLVPLNVGILSRGLGSAALAAVLLGWHELC